MILFRRLCHSSAIIIEWVVIYKIIRLPCAVTSPPRDAALSTTSAISPMVISSFGASRTLYHCNWTLRWSQFQYIRHSFARYHFQHIVFYERLLPQWHKLPLCPWSAGCPQHAGCSFRAHPSPTNSSHATTTPSTTRLPSGRTVFAFHPQKSGTGVSLGSK